MAQNALPDVLTVHVDPAQGLTNLERVVGLLRGRRHPVASVSARLDADVATVVVSGVDLHGGDPDALVVRRLERLPGVLAVFLDATEPSRERADDPADDAEPVLERFATV
jgi:hypothetical protein